MPPTNRGSERAEMRIMSRVVPRSAGRRISLLTAFAEEPHRTRAKPMALTREFDPVSYATFLLMRALDRFGLASAANDLRNRVGYQLDRDLQRKNAAFAPADHLPMPPAHLACLVTGSYSLEWLYNNGLVGADCIRAVLARNGLDIRAFKRMLDFGCGCGRILRHWKSANDPEIHGSDYNPRLIAWCRRALPFATFKVNGLAPGLSYEDGLFDFIYLISVMTHLSKELQRSWMRELSRVLEPGGYLYLTFHGMTRLGQLSGEERRRLRADGVLIRYERYAGSNRCATYNSDRYVREELCAGLMVLDFIPGGAKDADQDIYLVRKE